MIFYRIKKLFDKIFGKKVDVSKTCFSCGKQTTNPYTVQYTHSEGISNMDLCDECGKVFDDMAQLVEKAIEDRNL